MIRRFPAETVASALASWTFLDLGDKVAHFTSPFGDVFLEGPDVFWIVDIIGGSMKELCRTGEELTALLNSREGRDELLLAELGFAAEESGLVPGQGEIYDFRVPPVLGGALDVANLQVTDFEVAVSLAGQIHAQVRDLPPGTPVGEIRLS